MTDEIKTILNDIRKEKGAIVLQPQHVVDASRPEDAPLHGHFDWDDASAGEKYRLEQARRLIRTVYVEMPTTPPVLVRAYVSVPEDRVSGGGYRELQTIVTNESMLLQIAHEIRYKVELWQKQLKNLNAIIDMQPILDVAEAIEKKRKASKAQRKQPAQPAI